ncbi:ABC transporter permease [Paenibacillus thiaminolyticus]|uniref:ABC transporter permease n=1 Tax=Paenibacillus thiaminolyticus TaxID=49283 RepID=A0AAP9DS35_PANTH|nr:ABC transporter permease [Paenibacillus thiaminolyticus]MCY9536604.1 ABC transporter permease [Paenibacillus thiaminolyticus]MCY9601495.1 ABC transporter permease [Paenibacillus thiaminolyticus]MCY9608919.1 ABC transporter permease [Paenibacillus thiaminolyticus]MCY9612120.1 ABC transporter permease [Paenibacillus thiaminolyticus]MCY9619555.1 ABC transporter permease [Paenibacillus thiaminolyticus]
MNIRQFALKNVFRNKRLYAGYFFSCAFSVMIFFVYSMLALHPALDFSGNGNYGRGAQAGMDVAQYIIYLFTFFFILYSMSSFLKSRKKEFGICIMHGMSDMQLRRLVFTENIVIGLGATVSGIGAGLALSKWLLLMSSSVLTLEQPLSFYFPVKAIAMSGGAFVLLFLIISLFTASILRSSSLIDLLKGSVKPKPEPKASRWLAFLAVFLLALGYGVAFWVKGVLVIFALLPVATVVSIGTYFLFTQLSVYIINRLKTKKLYRRGTNLITLSDLAYRMKDNARMFFLVAIISTVAFTAIGTLVGLKAVFTNMSTSGSPVMRYESHSGNKLEAKHAELIEQSLNKAGISYEAVVFPAKFVEDAKTEKSYQVISVSDYNQLMKTNLGLRDDEAHLFYQVNPMNIEQEKSEETSVALAADKTFAVTANEAMPEEITQNVGGRKVIVLSDAAFQGLPGSERDDMIYTYLIEDWKSTLAVAKQLNKQLGDPDGNYLFGARALMLNDVNQGFGQIYLSGLFIGAVFFVAAGSFLYLRLYSDLDQDTVQYRAISKLGLTEGELSKIVSTQIGLLFFVPIVVAIVHGAVALNSLQNTFSMSLVKESAIVLGSFLAIQIIYFIFIRANYVRKLKKVI